MSIQFIHVLSFFFIHIIVKQNELSLAGGTRMTRSEKRVSHVNQSMCVDVKITFNRIEKNEQNVNKMAGNKSI